ncbi:MAG: type III secretion system export apparatus subunit SctR [Chthoniobacterales bacterium]|nr:type III secretion system export apparatus subunit SctR [Chthoniobacterales bacterium]
MNLNIGNPLELILVLGAVAMLPFIVVMVTSFAKVIVVFSLVRTALGLQSSPPNMVLNGMAIILSIYVMFPVLSDTYKLSEKLNISNVTIASIGPMMNSIKEPIETFLSNNSKVSVQKFFAVTAKRIWPPKYGSTVSQKDFIILVPSFLVSELTAAFQIGFILYLPFIIIDLVISNILMALGMMMLSPTTISLPFKLLLFCFVDGWTRIMDGLIMTYRIS